MAYAEDAPRRHARKQSSIVSVAWSPDGRRIATGCEDMTAQVWDAASGRHLLSYHGHKEPVNVVAWSPNGKRVASGSDDGSIHIWDTNKGFRWLMYRGHETIEVENLAWSPDGSRIASIDEDIGVHIWDSTSGKLLRKQPGRYRAQEQYAPLAWSPDGARIASPLPTIYMPSYEPSYEPTIEHGAYVWDAATGETLLKHYHENLQLYVIAWSPDGRVVASADDGTVHLWDARNGSEVFTYRGHLDLDGSWGHTVSSLAWSPDGSRIASGSDGTVLIWSARTGETLSKRSVTASIRAALAWSPDSKCLAVGGEEKTLQVWQMG